MTDKLTIQKPLETSGEEALLMPEKTPHAMMVLALQHNADPAVLSRLLDLQERYDAQIARKAYVEAMTAFKKDAPAVLRKDAQVDFTSAKGRTHYRHATLGSVIDQITVALSSHGLSVSWETKQQGVAISVTCHVTHAKGHRESVTLVGPADDSGNKNPIQQIGSSVTYLQRYTLLAALGLATADQDDIDEPKKPVAMPTAKPATESRNADAKPTAPAAAPTGSKVATGMVEDINTKTGSGKRGAWTKYGVKVGGNWYGTFDDKHGKLAEDAKVQERAVRIEYKEDGKFQTIVDIAMLGDAAEPEQTGDDQQGAPADELPWFEQPKQ